MDFDRTFTIKMNDGTEIKANIIVNFEYATNKYCIYSINTKDGANLYCAKNIDGNLIKITNSEEQAFVNTVVEKIVNAVKER